MGLGIAYGGLIPAASSLRFCSMHGIQGLGFCLVRLFLAYSLCVRGTVAFTLLDCGEVFVCRCINCLRTACMPRILEEMKNWV